MGCAPRDLGGRLTAEEYNQLLSLWNSGDLQ
jgi:hypothetical protein